MSETRKAELPRGAAELTPRVLALGLLLSVVLGAANVYVGLKVGMTVSASVSYTHLTLPTICSV